MGASLARALAITLILCLACEGALQVATGSLFPEGQPTFLPWMGLDPVFGWRNIPDAPVGRVVRSDGAELELGINSLGFRGPEVGEKASGGLRVVCLGDSATFGVIQSDEPGAADRHQPVVSYADELGRIVQEKGLDHVEVINAGVVGYTSSHGLRQLILQVLPLEPDVVTFRFGVNDQYDSMQPARRATEPPPGAGRTLLYAFHAWKLFRLGLAAYQQLAEQPTPGSVVWVTEGRFRRNVERFAEVAEENGVHLLVLDFPIGPLRRIGPGYPSEGAARTFHRRIRKNTTRLQKIAQEVAASRGVPVLFTAGPKAPRRTRLFNDRDYAHPTVDGAAFIAELLFEKLDSLGWLAR